jgi:lipoyl(octanoyl) transferase
MSGELRARWFGRISYGDALAMQEELVAAKRADGSLPDELLLLEHEPVYTIGRTPDQSSLRGAAHLPHPLFPINRGGQATYHGPGQLVGYPIIDLRRQEQDLHRYLRWLEEVLIELLAGYDVAAQTRAGLTGVWVEDRKIASIGVGVRQWITMHGFALNVAGDLSAFDQIVPCGIANVAMTSIEKECGRAWPVEEVAMRAGQLLASRLHGLQRTKEIAPARA